MKHKQEISAGGVVFRRRGLAIRLCLVNTHGGRDWQFPKGHIEAGETLEMTALREVKEETGLTATILCPLTITRYTFMRRRKQQTVVDKTVQFYLMRYRHGRLTWPEYEIKEARWFSPEEAQKRLTYPNEKNIARKALTMIHKQ